MDVVVDASVWIDHLHRSDPKLVALLQAGEVVMHSAVLGELACGTLPKRAELLELWWALRTVPEINSIEAIALIEQRHLWGEGLGWTDVLLLGSALLAGAKLWTRDRPLQRVASELGVSLTTKAS